MTDVAPETPEVDAPPEGTDAPKTETEPKGPLPDDPAALRAELDKVRKEAAKYRTEARDLKPLADKARQQEDADKTETQRLADANAAEKARADKAEQDLMRYRVASVKKLPDAFVDRLKGDTEEDMAADADLLLKAMERTPGSADGGARDRDDKPKRSTSLASAVDRAISGA